jgi:hypothetical protein
MRSSLEIIRAVSVSFALVATLPSYGAYLRAESAPVMIAEIYANEWGSPFVQADVAINAACASSGRGMYLYNLEATANTQFRNNKMAMILTAKMAGKRVRLDYFYDSAKVGWDACYIHGIGLVD